MDFQVSRLLPCCKGLPLLAPAAKHWMPQEANLLPCLRMLDGGMCLMGEMPSCLPDHAEAQAVLEVLDAHF